MKKYLAIDIGNVICNLNFDSLILRISEYTGLTENQAYGFLIGSQKNHDLGLTTFEFDVINLTKRNVSDFKIKSSVERLMEEWYDTVKLNPIMIEWLKNLLNQGVEIALVSNIGIEHSSYMKTVLSEIYDRVELIKFFSCEAGCRKPSFLYYNLFLSMYPQFKGCVYMDDNIDNIETGKMFGFRSINFDLSKMTDDEIKARLVNIESLI